MTTTPTIDGYYITQYLGIVSGEAAIPSDFFTEIDANISVFWGVNATGYSSKVGESKVVAVNKMKNNALAIGATAVVGVDIDIMNTNANNFITSANGTAVITEKLKKDRL